MWLEEVNYGAYYKIRHYTASGVCVNISKCYLQWGLEDLGSLSLLSVREDQLYHGFQQYLEVREFREHPIEEAQQEK